MILMIIVILTLFAVFCVGYVVGKLVAQHMDYDPTNDFIVVN